MKSIGAVADGWDKIDLRKCEVLQSEGDAKVFKIMVPNPNREPGAKQKDKEERFKTSDMCSRNIWFRKLMLAKLGSQE